MNYRIRRKAGELHSSNFMEIGPGRYSGKHWQDGFLFVTEDAFEIAEVILVRHFADYDHYGMNEIPKSIGMKIIDAWRQTADNIVDSSAAEAAFLLDLPGNDHHAFELEIAEHADDIAAMLNELANECGLFYQAHDWISILGI